METEIKLTENACFDAGLVVAARLGNEKAYALLMNRYKDAIFYRILKMVGHKMDAEELTIETFEKAFANIHLYDTKYAFSTWLFSIALNNALDHLRKKKLITVPLESTFDEDNLTGNGYERNHSHASDNPEEALIKKQNALLLHKTISCLKPKYQTILEMRYFRELTYNEISKELNLPIVTVKVQLFRSRELLFNLLKNNFINNRHII
ncbi:MAG TPA: sigma-70 family RNA polymerase sigma factor [Prolixibacteraceae bacterium]|jgi:RNA polymerase sigma-70 factor (ECF subfamily)